MLLHCEYLLRDVTGAIGRDLKYHHRSDRAIRAHTKRQEPLNFKKILGREMIPIKNIYILSALNNIPYRIEFCILTYSLFQASPASRPCNGESQRNVVKSSTIAKCSAATMSEAFRWSDLG